MEIKDEKQNNSVLDLANTGGVKEKSWEETLQENELKVKEREAQMRKDRENALKLAIQRGNQITDLEDKMRDLAMKYETLENRHYQTLSKEITSETKEAETDPARIVARTVMDVVEQQRVNAINENKNKTTYYLI